MADYSDWIGRERRKVETPASGDLARLAVVLDRPEPPDIVPPAWHWACAVDTPRQSDLGEDGHPRRGGFMPPVAAPRRMFAGATMDFLAPLNVGVETEWVETIVAITEKAGASGPLTFVEVARTISQAGAPCVSETQTIVYREPSASPAPTIPAPTDEAWATTVTPEASLLARFSAATFNGHRIHYDRDYATTVEGYPGLVVHGPLIALMLLEAMNTALPGATLASFSFRALAPLFDRAPFEACGKLAEGGAELWARGPDGALAMSARATFA